ncbi:BatA domain-containing protein [Acanthopleuribacter pedis]|uniref:BatA domain-containing protein n=1 Tax=Acanthopleuribacter pedis TaxID=442870 RepID=A0A8J7QAI0_9BACT|nr:BatA domain-containing protein [Acanthopleuribacter pedis]
MSFVFPWFLGSLVGLIPLVACYFFVGRVKSQQVSNLFLWQQAELVPRAGAKPKQFDRNVLLPLEILILILLVLAAARPQWLTREAAPLLGVVLDDSFSMQALHDGADVRTRALAGLRRQLQQETFRDVYFVTAGPSPRLLDLGVWSPDQSDAFDRLAAEWSCKASGADLQEAQSLARQIGGEQAHIWVVTDHGATDAPPPGVQRLAFGLPADNRAFVNAVRADESGGSEILFEVMQGKSSQPFVVTCDDGRTQQYSFDAAPGEVVAHRVKVQPNATRVTLTLADDALVADNRVILLRQPKPTIRVALDLKQEDLEKPIRRALTATGMVRLSADQPHLLIHDSDQPVKLPPDPSRWTLAIRQPKHTRVYQGPFILNRRHPLTEGLVLRGALWAAGTRSVPGRPLVTVGDVALLAHEPGRQAQHFTLQCDPGSGNLALSPNWPILFDNLIRACVASLPGTDAVNYRAGQPVRWRPAPGTSAVTLVPETGPATVVPLSGDRLWLPLTTPGVHQVIVRAEDGSETRTDLALNLMQQEESDLRGAETGSWGDPPTPASQDRHATDVTPWFLAAAMILMLGHLLLSRRALAVAA